MFRLLTPKGVPGETVGMRSFPKPRNVATQRKTHGLTVVRSCRANILEGLYPYNVERGLELWGKATTIYAVSSVIAGILERFNSEGLFRDSRHSTQPGNSRAIRARSDGLANTEFRRVVGNHPLVQKSDDVMATSPKTLVILFQLCRLPDAAPDGLLIPMIEPAYFNRVHSAFTPKTKSQEPGESGALLAGFSSQHGWVYVEDPSDDNVYQIILRFHKRLVRMVSRECLILVSC